MRFMSREGVTVYPDALASGTEVGNWRVVERLGVGGYGAAYRVEDMARLQDFYVMKVALDPEDERAEREVALMMTRAAHPNVARFHGCSRWPHPRDGFRCFVMDWVPGPALHTWAESEGSTFLRLAEVGGKVALALDTLHERGVLHRDLKPEHIILRESDGEPVLIDFGAGWYEGAPSLTQGTLPPGTPHLRSPEAVRFLWEHHTHPGVHYPFQRTDELYALGVCLYRAATGHYPFSPEGMPDMLQHAIVHHPPHAPSDFNRRVPRALSEVILRLLAKKPEERYQRGAQVHEALVAAATFGDPKRWRASIFEWEEVAPEKEGDTPQRRLRRPERPTWSATPPPPRLVIPPPLPPPARELDEQEQDPFSSEPEPSDEQRRGARGGSHSPLLAALLAIMLGLSLLFVAKWLDLGPFASTPRPSPVASSLSPPTLELRHGQEVAPSWPPPEIERTAAPPPVGTIPAVVASPVTRPKDDAVKKQQAPSPQRDKKQKVTLSPMAQWCLGAAAAAHTACAGAQVPPAPASAPQTEECPAGAVETMTNTLGIDIGENVVVHFPFVGEHKPVPIREGFTSVKVRDTWGGLPSGTILHGHLHFGEGRVYGRFTDAKTPTGDTYNVCLEMWQEGKRGAEMERGSTATNMLIFSLERVKAVDRFE
jgi:serine/threonine protein kinase